jgi:hypothetical protein
MIPARDADIDAVSRLTIIPVGDADIDEHYG